jgi:3-deoxy-manno-octulosonate cytidylyltransferase (CMP-KDO synthetase)
VVEFNVPAVPVTRLPFTLTETSVLAVIPARYHSTRFPGKVLVDIAGRTMLEHVYRRAAAAHSVDAVLVATDDQRIVDAVDSFGGVVCLTSSAHASGTDRLAEVAAQLSCDLLVGVQGDEPLLDPAVIDAVVAPLKKDRQIGMATAARRLSEPRDLTNPNAVKVVCDREGYALYFSRAPIPHGRDGSAPEASVHVGLYVYRHETLLRLAQLTPGPLERAEALEQLRALEHGIRIKVVETTYESLGVDTPSDLDRIRQRLLASVPE